MLVNVFLFEVLLKISQYYKAGVVALRPQAMSTVPTRSTQKSRGTVLLFPWKTAPLLTNTSSPCHGERFYCSPNSVPVPFWFLEAEVCFLYYIRFQKFCPSALYYKPAVLQHIAAVGNLQCLLHLLLHQ